MSSRRKFDSIFVEALNDSDDSHLECIHRKTIEELQYEMDVAKFYRTLLRDNLNDRNSAKSSRRLKSEAIQTEPDTSGIPSSWLILGQTLVDELYTGLGNMINTLYHTPNGYCNGEAAKARLDPKKLKFFKYENGYWQSKLLPHVRIPVPVNMDRQDHSDNFKNDLYSLLEKATKLKNVIPYIMETEGGKDALVIERKIESTSGTETLIRRIDKMMDPTEDGSCDNPLDSNSCTGFSQKSGTDLPPVTAGTELLVQMSEFVLRNPANANNNEKQTAGMILDRKITTEYKPKPFQGVVIPECYLGPQASTCIKTSTPKQSKKILHAADSEFLKSESNRSELIINEEKMVNCTKPSAAVGKGNSSNSGKNALRINMNLQNTRNELGNACNLNCEKISNETDCIRAGKAGCSSKSKNFIKKNILASKFPVHRATTSKSVPDIEPLVSRVGQKGKINRK